MTKVLAILGIVLGALGFVCSEALFVEYVMKDSAWCIFYAFMALSGLACVILNSFEIHNIKSKEDKEELLRLIAEDKKNEK